MPRSAIVLLACLAACGDEPGVHLRATDWWGRGLGGVLVQVHDSEVGPLITDPDGFAELPMSRRWLVTLSGDGLLQRTVEVRPPDPLRPHVEIVQLVTIPPGPGFQVIAAEGYEPLRAAPIHRVGKDLGTRVGLPEVAAVTVRGPVVDLLFHRPLKLLDVDVAAMELHRLEPLSGGPVAAADDPDDDIPSGPVHYASVGRLPFRSIRLAGAADHLVRVEGLSAGLYAFVPPGALTPRSEKEFERLPGSRRTAFPFRVEVEEVLPGAALPLPTAPAPEEEEVEEEPASP